MAEGQQDQDFLVEDVEAIIKASLQATLSSVAYDQEKVNLWTTQVVDSTLKGLQSLEKQFKYVVTVIIMQKTGAGLHTSAGAFWDTRRDGEQRGGEMLRGAALNRPAHRGRRGGPSGGGPPCVDSRHM